METIIELQGLTRRFGAVTALNDIDLTIQKGELFGIVGPDGAGKSTLLRLMAAVLDPSAGTAHIHGFDSVHEAEQVKHHIGYMPQRFGLYPDLTVAENLDFAAQLFGVKGAERTERLRRLYEFTILERFKKRPAGLLSGGMKKKLGLACAMIHHPAILLLDEPTTGVDPVARRNFWDLLSGLHAEGITTVVSTPYMDEAERCNRVALLFKGRVLACDTPARIKDRVPGKVVVLETSDNHRAHKLLEDGILILDIQTYGEQLNLVMQSDTPHVLDAIRQRLDGITIKRLEPTPIRMEEAFIYLVNRAEREVLA